MGLLVDKVALGQVLLFSLVSDPLPYFIHVPPMLYSNLSK